MKIDRRKLLGGAAASALSTPAHSQFAIFQLGGTASPPPPPPGGGFGAPQLQVSGLHASITTAFDETQAQDIYTPGNEGPAVSTTDYYHISSIMMMRPYDLDTMGAPGAAVKAANAGNRYVWIISVDHADGGAKSHRDSFSFYIGFSSDPGIPPSVFTTIIQWNNTWLGDATTPGADGWTMGGDFGPTSFLYNPDDIDFPFYLYTQGFGNGFGLAYQTQSILWKSTNLFDWVGGAWGPRSLVGDPAIDYSVIQLTSHQTVTRHGTGDWTSLGIIGYLGWAGVGKWSSTDGKTWTADTTIYNITGFPSVNLTMDAGSGTPNRLTAASGIFSAPATGQTIGAIVYAPTGHVTFTSAYWFTKIEYISSTQVDLVVQYSGIPTGPITFTNAAAPLEFGTVCYRKGPATSGGGVSGYGAFGALPESFLAGSQLYQCVIEDARHENQPEDNGMWSSVAAVDADYNISQTIPAIPVSSKYDGIYPGRGFVQQQSNSIEDGIAHIYAMCGYGPHNTSTTPYVGATVVGDVNGGTFTIDNLSGTGGFVPVGGFVQTNYYTIGTVTGQTSGSTGGAGTYTITNSGGWVVPAYIGTFGLLSVDMGAGSVTGSISGTTFTVSTVSGTIAVGATVQAAFYLGQITGFTSGTPGGAGVYTIDNVGVTMAAHSTGIIINSGPAYLVSSAISNGNFAQQFMDYYTIAFDSGLAARAAPFGVTASCNNNTVTISWMDTPLEMGSESQAYNVYRGTTGPPTTIPGTQATQVGTTTSMLSVTDTPTPGSIYWYKVVKVSGGVEYASANRVVSVYVG